MISATLTHALDRIIEEEEEQITHTEREEVKPNPYKIKYNMKSLNDITIEKLHLIFQGLDDKLDKETKKRIILELGLPVNTIKKRWQVFKKLYVRRKTKWELK